MGIVETRETVRACKHCFMCRYISPHFIATKLESCTPKGYGILLSEIDEGKREWNADIIESFYQSSLGGECREDCFFHWNEDQMIRDAREEIVGLGMAPGYVTGIADNLIRFGRPENNSGCAVPGKYAGKKTAGLLFIPGSSIGTADQIVVDAGIKILEAAGKDFMVPDGSLTSGTELFDLGYTDAAKGSGKSLVDFILNRNISTVVTACPAVLRAFREFYPQWGISLPEGLKVLHLAEFATDAIESGLLKPDKVIKSEAVFHDGSYMGRKLGIFDAPRRVLQSCLSSGLHELYFNRAKAQSSGAGTVMYLTHPELAADIARRVLDEAADDGIELIVSASQNSVKTFKSACVKYGFSIEVRNIAEVLADCL